MGKGKKGNRGYEYGGGRQRREYRTTKTVGTGERTIDPSHREEDRFHTDSATGEQYRQKHVGYGTKEYLKEKWLSTSPVDVNANYYSAGKNDPGITPEGQRGAYGFAHIEGGRVTSGKKYETLANPDNPLYEYEKTGTVREEGKPSSSYQRSDDFDSPGLGGGPRQSAGGRSRGAWDDEPVDAEIVDEPVDPRRSTSRRDDTIDAEGWDVEPELGQGSRPGVGGPVGLPFRRNAGAVGPGSTMQAAGRIGMGAQLALPPGGMTPEAERTEEGALPMSAGNLADMHPGFNTGAPTAGSRRGAKRPKPGELGKMWGGLDAPQQDSVFEARTRAYSKILQPPQGAGPK